MVCAAGKLLSLSASAYPVLIRQWTHLIYEDTVAISRLYSFLPLKAFPVRIFQTETGKVTNDIRRNKDEKKCIQNEAEIRAVMSASIVSWFKIFICLKRN